MTPPLLTHRCWNHGERLAVVRCPSCSRYFCRECVAEHDGRMACAACLKSGDTRRVAARSWLGPFWRIVQTAAAVVVLWLFFVGVGRVLLLIPNSVHEGTIWSQSDDAEASP